MNRTRIVPPSGEAATRSAPPSRPGTRLAPTPVRLARGLSVTLTELRCAAVTAALLLRRRLALPTRMVGQRVRFGDGTESTIYRETRVVGRAPSSPVTLVVRFRLRLLGVNRAAHALFRAESLLNTPLFAGQPGFCSKLWLTDRVTGFYRGIYEWDGAESAGRYGETLRVVLAPFVQQGTFDYQVLPGQERESYLASTDDAEGSRSAGEWWRAIGDGNQTRRT